MEKPVWRINTGNGVPSDFKSGFLYMDGSLFFCNDVATMPEIYFSLEADYSESDVSAYETNRTKAAKFERVECEYCKGCGFVQNHLCVLELLFEHKKCLKCQGRGYVWKMGVEA